MLHITLIVLFIYLYINCYLLKKGRLMCATPGSIAAAKRMLGIAMMRAPLHAVPPGGIDRLSFLVFGYFDLIICLSKQRT